MRTGTGGLILEPYEDWYWWSYPRTPMRTGTGGLILELVEDWYW